MWIQHLDMNRWLCPLFSLYQIGNHWKKHQNFFLKYQNNAVLVVSIAQMGIACSQSSSSYRLKRERMVDQSSVTSFSLLEPGFVGQFNGVIYILRDWFELFIQKIIFPLQTNFLFILLSPCCERNFMLNHVIWNSDVFSLSYYPPVLCPLIFSTWTIKSLTA